MGAKAGDHVPSPWMRARERDRFACAREVVRQKRMRQMESFWRKDQGDERGLQNGVEHE
jgi:hypothetical protein